MVVFTADNTAWHACVNYVAWALDGGGRGLLVGEALKGAPRLREEKGAAGVTTGAPSCSP